MIYKVLFISLSFFLIGSCGSSNSSEPEGQAMDGTYVLTKLGNEDLASEGFTFEFDAEESAVYGKTGCNGFSAGFIQEDSTISFTAPISTRKFCQGKMETEQQILGALEGVAEFKKDGNTYVLYSQEDKPLITLTKKD